MLSFERIQFDNGKQPGPFARILAVAAGLVLLGASLFLGVIFLFAAVFFVAVVAIVARLKGPTTAMGPGSETAAHRSVLEGEYVVVESKHKQNMNDGEK
jgi:hypothetical protein